MKQTAVEWFAKELNNWRIKKFGEDAIIGIPQDVFEQALEMDKEQKIAFGKKCFYKGFKKAENDDANCFTAWREEAPELTTFKSE